MPLDDKTLDEAFEIYGEFGPNLRVPRKARLAKVYPSLSSEAIDELLNQMKEVDGTVCLLAGFRGIVWWQYRLPNETRVHNQFNLHRSDFTRFVEMMKTDPKTRFIDDGGRIYDDGIHFRVMEQYRDLMDTIGAKSVRVQEDGTVDFTMGGFGGAIISDSQLSLPWHLPR